AGAQPVCFLACMIFVSGEELQNARDESQTLQRWHPQQPQAGRQIPEFPAYVNAPAEPQMPSCTHGLWLLETPSRLLPAFRLFRQAVAPRLPRPQPIADRNPPATECVSGQ